MDAEGRISAWAQKVNSGSHKTTQEERVGRHKLLWIVQKKRSIIRTPEKK